MGSGAAVLLSCHCSLLRCRRPPFPGGHETAEVVDRPRCDVIIGRLLTSPSAAAAVVAFVVDGNGMLLKMHLLIDYFC